MAMGWQWCDGAGFVLGSCGCVGVGNGDGGVGGYE